MPDATPIDGEFDYIVVGAGSAGCVLGQPIVGGSGKTGAAVGGGRQGQLDLVSHSSRLLFAIGNPRADWLLKTEPEPGLNGRSLNYPRGKVIGGSSAINGMIYMLGQVRRL